jgi:hypothetical protein
LALIRLTSAVQCGIIFLEEISHRGNATQAKVVESIGTITPYVRVSVNFYAFNQNGNRGVACGLGNIQKVKDGDSLMGRSNAADDFDAEDDDDFLA